MLFVGAKSAPKKDTGDECQEADDGETATEHTESTEAGVEFELVHFNVGGRLVVTTRATLWMAPPDSLLALAFGRDADPKWLPRRLADGSYFFDLNATYFEALLDLMRHGDGLARSFGPETLGGVCAVADFLSMPDVAKRCADAAVPSLSQAMTGPDYLQRQVRVLVNAKGHARTLDLCDWTKCQRLTVHARWTLRQVRNTILAQCTTSDDGTAEACFYACYMRSDHTVRPMCLIDMENDDVLFGEIEWASCKQQRNLGACFFVTRDVVPLVSAPFDKQHETLDASQLLCALAPPLLPPHVSAWPDDGPLLVFLKYYDGQWQTLSPPIAVVIDRSTVVSHLLPTFCRLLGQACDDGTRYAVYNERGFKEPARINQSGTFALGNVMFGDVLWVRIVGQAGVAPRCVPAPRWTVMHAPSYIAH